MSIDITGSAYYPIKETPGPGTWYIYQEGKEPVTADSIMNRDSIPSLAQIRSLANAS